MDSISLLAFGCLALALGLGIFWLVVLFRTRAKLRAMEKALGRKKGKDDTWRR